MLPVPTRTDESNGRVIFSRVFPHPIQIALLCVFTCNTNKNTTISAHILQKNIFSSQIIVSPDSPIKLFFCPHKIDLSVLSWFPSCRFLSKHRGLILITNVHASKICSSRSREKLSKNLTVTDILTSHLNTLPHNRHSNIFYTNWRSLENPPNYSFPHFVKPPQDPSLQNNWNRDLKTPHLQAVWPFVCISPWFIDIQKICGHIPSTPQGPLVQGGFRWKGSLFKLVAFFLL